MHRTDRSGLSSHLSLTLARKPYLCWTWDALDLTMMANGLYHTTITTNQHDRAQSYAPAILTMYSLKLPPLLCSCGSGSADIGICENLNSCCPEGG